MNLTGMTLVERVRYSDLEDSFKDSLLDKIDQRIDVKTLRSELLESKLYVDEDIIYDGDISKLKKSELIDVIDDYKQAFEELLQSVEYHQEKVREILQSLPVE